MSSVGFKPHSQKKLKEPQIRNQRIKRRFNQTARLSKESVRLSKQAYISELDGQTYLVAYAKYRL
jgi:ribosomal protein S16